MIGSRSWSRRAIVTSVLGSALMATSGVASARASVELVYNRSENAASCPDESALRIEVAKRIGYDPFVEKASDGRRVVASIERRASGEFHGQVHLEVNEVAGDAGRELDAVDCAELVSSMALTTSVLLEPLAGRHRRTQPPPSLVTTPRELPELGSPPPLPQPSSPPARTEIGLRIGAFVVGSIASAPTAALGVEALVGIGLGPRSGRAVWSFDGGARFDLESGSSSSSHGARSSLTLGEFVPCRHLGVVAVCAAVDAGSFRGQVPESASGKRAKATFFAAVGPRLGLEVPIGAGFALAAHTELAGVLTRTTIRVGDEELWTTPPIFVSLGAGVLWTIR